MYEENNNIINFTTQNSFLHYGVKGMKWGVITSEYEPVGRLRSRYSQWQNGRKNTAARQLTSKVAGKDYNAIKTVNSRQTDQPLQRQKNVTGKDDGYTMARKDEKIRNEDNLKKVIANSNAVNKQKTETETISNKDNAFQNKDVQYGIDRADALTKEDLDKFDKAFESISDMDEKYSQKLFDRYKDKIEDKVNSYCYYMTEALYNFEDSHEEAKTFADIRDAGKLADRFDSYSYRIDKGKFNYTDYVNFMSDRKHAQRLIDSLSGANDYMVDDPGYKSVEERERPGSSKPYREYSKDEKKADKKADKGRSKKNK